MGHDKQVNIPGANGKSTLIVIFFNLLTTIDLRGVNFKFGNNNNDSNFIQLFYRGMLSPFHGKNNHSKNYQVLSSKSYRFSLYHETEN